MREYDENTIISIAFLIFVIIIGVYVNCVDISDVNTTSESIDELCENIDDLYYENMTAYCENMTDEELAQLYNLFYNIK